MVWLGWSVVFMYLFVCVRAVRRALICYSAHQCKRIHLFIYHYRSAQEPNNVRWNNKQFRKIVVSTNNLFIVCYNDNHNINIATQIGEHLCERMGGQFTSIRKTLVAIVHIEKQK